MKTFISTLTLAAFSLFFNQNINAQNDETAYVIVEYMKVKPGMESDYRKCEKVWKLIHQERIKAGLITGWDFEQILYPRGSNTEYDYLTITHLKSWKAIDELDKSWNSKTWANLTKNLSEKQLVLANNANQYRDIVKKEIWRAADIVFAPGDTRPQYAVENFMKIPAGGWDDWVEMETQFVKPVHQKNIKMGNRAGWLIGFMILPRGDDYPYQGSTIDFYNTWEDMEKDESKAWKAIYPSMDPSRVKSRIEATRTLVKTEVRKLLYFVD